MELPGVQKRISGAYSYPLRELLMVRVSQIFDKRGWTQKQAAEFLGVTQPRISDLTRARVENFTIDLLVDWLGVLGQSVSIESKEAPGEPHSLLQRFSTTEDSIPYYTKAITIDPLCATNYVKRGDAYFAQNNIDLAVGDYTRAMELDTGRLDWRLRRADCYLMLVQFKAAIYDCQFVLKLIESKQLSAYDQLVSVENKKRIVQEITWWAYLCLGRALQGAEQEDEALDAFECAIKTAPHFGRSYFEKGRLHEKREEYEQALEDYNRACQCDPSDVPSSDHLAGLRRKLMQAQGQDQEQKNSQTAADEEIDSLSVAIDLATSPAMKAHYFRKRAEIFQNRSQFTLAIADFTRAMELDPQQSWVWSHVAYGRFMTEDYSGVISDCDKVINSDWDPVRKSAACMYKGWALEKLNLDDSALEYYELGVAINPQDTALILTRGLLLEKMGKTASALTDYREAIYLSSSNPGVPREFVEQAKGYKKKLEGKIAGNSSSLSSFDLREVEFVVYDRLSPQAERVFYHANQTAMAMGHDCLCTEFLLIGLLKEQSSIAALQLERIGLRTEDVEGAVEILIGRNTPFMRTGRFPISVTARLRHVLQLALDYSLHQGEKRITPEHLLLGLVLEILACQKLDEQGIDPGKDELFGIAARIILDLNIDVEHWRWTIVKACWG